MSITIEQASVAVFAATASPEQIRLRDALVSACATRPAPVDGRATNGKQKVARIDMKVATPSAIKGVDAVDTLSSYDRVRNALTSSEWLTHSGVVDASGVSHGSTYYALRKMQSEGVVERTRLNIEGTADYRYVYRLVPPI